MGEASRTEMSSLRFRIGRATDAIADQLPAKDHIHRKWVRESLQEELQLRAYLRADGSGPGDCNAAAEVRLYGSSPFRLGRNRPGRLQLHQPAPQRVSVFVVVVHDRDEPPRVRDRPQEAPSRRLGRVQEGPLFPEGKRLLLQGAIGSQQNATMRSCRKG